MTQLTTVSGTGDVSLTPDTEQGGWIVTAISSDTDAVH